MSGLERTIERCEKMKEYLLSLEQTEQVKKDIEYMDYCINSAKELLSKDEQ